MVQHDKLPSGVCHVRLHGWLFKHASPEGIKYMFAAWQKTSFLRHFWMSAFMTFLGYVATKSRGSQVSNSDNLGATLDGL